MKNLRKIFAVLLASAMMVTTLSGCEKEKETSTENVSPTTTVADDAAAITNAAVETQVAGIDGWTAFSSNVTLRIPVYDRGVEGVPTVNDNYWTKWVQTNFGDKYNVTVEYVPITRTDVMTDYALLASSGDLPTICMEYDYPKVTQWASDGYLATFSIEDFAQVAPTYYNRMVELEQLDLTKLNDETYYCLTSRPFSNVNYTWNTWVRMDWLKQVGYDHVPVTRAEYVDAMAKITEAGLSEHPGGGAMITGVGSDQDYAFRTFPQNEEVWAQAGDPSIPSLGSDSNYKVVKRANEDYNLGITNPEYYITDEETNKAAFINGDTYSYYGYISATMDWLVSFYEQNPDAELAIIPSGVVDEAGGTVPAYRTTPPNGMIVGFSSGATADEMKAAWMYMEWMTQEDTLKTMQWGVEGENYTVNADGIGTTVGDYDGEYKQGFNNNKDYWCVTTEVRVAGTIEDMITIAAPQGLRQDFTQNIIDKYYADLELYNQGYGCMDVLFSKSIDAVTEYGTALNSKYIEYRDKLTMCKPEEFDTLYKQFTQEYLDAGYQAIKDERLQKFKDGFSTKLVTK